MLLSPTERESWTPDTAQDRQSVLAQMERILTSLPFRHSKRYPVLLRYVVEQTLDGRCHNLKERTLGIEVFQRHAAYDTNLDPIVRVTAGEVRKRIAQYYHESGHADEIRIDLPPGSYVPVFHLGPDASLGPVASGIDAVTYEATDSLPAFTAPIAEIVSEGSTSPASRNRSWRFVVWTIGAVALAIIVFTSVRFYGKRGRTLDKVWAPILSPAVPVLISMGEPILARRAGEASSTEETATDTSVTVSQHTRGSDTLAFADVQAFSRIAGYLDTEHRSYHLQVASITSFADLRQGPTILIGGFDNPWTLRALRPLRFHFAREPGSPLRIVDDHDPGSRKWAIDFTQIYADLGEDYAIVAGFTDPDTHQPLLVIAGIGENGTRAAGELITDPEYFKTVPPRHGERPNFEAVVRTKVINGISGPPTVLAIEEW